MPRPLQKCRRDGSLYARRPEIEQAINLAVQQDRATILARAAILDRSVADYLPSECLLHLIRDARRRGDDAGFNGLVRVLVMRCVVMVRRGVSRGLRYAADARNEIVDQLMELIAVDGSAEDKQRLDYFEVNFDHGFKMLRINVVRVYRARADEETPDEDPGANVSSDDDVPRAFLTRERMALVADNLDILTVQERTAIGLHYLRELEVESDNQKKITVATLMGISGRHVRTILRRAEQKLLTLEEKK